LILASCAKPSPPPGVDVPKPQAPDPRICTDVRKTPGMPSGASIVQPDSQAERTATAIFLGWVADLVDAATENEGRAVLAKKAAC
jgi:hypothetical protein